jgi:hypothetical protein
LKPTIEACPTGKLSRRDLLKLAGVCAAASPWASNRLAAIFDESSIAPFNPISSAETHDLQALLDWGPYSKKYFGVTHIPDVRRGFSFDLSIFPLLTPGPVSLPNVTEKSGVHPWEESPNLDYYLLRMETIWKDQFYYDISFSRLSSSSRLIQMELVNHAGAPQEVAINSLTQLNFPPLRAFSIMPIWLYDVELPYGAVWVHAVDHVDLQFVSPRPTDNLVPDGQWRGEERGHDCVAVRCWPNLSGGTPAIQFRTAGSWNGLTQMQKANYWTWSSTEIL